MRGRKEGYHNIWKTVPGYEDYQASFDGDIRRIYKNGKIRILNQFTCGGRSDQLHVNLYKDGRYKVFTVGRVVASAFLGPCPPGYVAHHKNGLTRDNCAGNLSYIPKNESTVRAAKSKGRPVVKIDQWGEVVACYGSCREAAKRNYTYPSVISNHCNGKVANKYSLDGCEYAWDDVDEHKRMRERKQCGNT